MGTDIKVLGYVAAALLLFMTLMLLLTVRQGARVRGVTNWVRSTLAIAAGIGLNTLQDTLPQFLSSPVANVLVVAGVALAAFGTYEYRYRRTLSLRWLAVACFVLLLVLVALREYSGARIVLVALLTGSFATWHAWTTLAGSSLRPHAKGVKHSRFGLPHAIMVLGLATVATVVLVHAGDALAMLNGSATGTVPFGGPQRTLLLLYIAVLAGRLLLLIGMVLVLVDEMANELRTLAQRDSLTGVLNRRGLKDAVSALPLERSSLLILDLDHFKAVNDDLGHDRGDQVIVLLARCMQTHLPPDAVCARLGGEEFCALLPNVEGNEAYAAAEALRNAFARESLALEHGRAHTVSIGIASYDIEVTTLSHLMRHADEALYRAKREGRNRVVRHTAARTA